MTKCWLHLGPGDEKGKILPFSQFTYEKCLDVMKKRKNVLRSKYSCIGLPPEQPLHAGYHKECYRNYTALPKRYSDNIAITDIETVNINSDFDQFVDENEIENEVSIQKNVVLKSSSNETMQECDISDKQQRIMAVASCSVVAMQKSNVSNVIQKHMISESSSIEEMQRNIASDSSIIEVMQPCDVGDVHQKNKAVASSYLEAMQQSNASDVMQGNSAPKSFSVEVMQQRQYDVSEVQQRNVAITSSCVESIQSCDIDEAIQRDIVVRPVSSPSQQYSDVTVQANKSMPVPVSICVICEKNRYKNKQKLPLMCCTSDSYKDELFKYAISKNNFDLVAKIQESCECIYYHKSCISEIDLLNLSKIRDLSDVSFNSRRRIHKIAFQTLCELIEEFVIKKACVITLDELFNDYNCLLLEYGNLVDSDYVPSKLKIKILCHFTDRISVINSVSKKGHCYFYKSSLSAAEVSSQSMAKSDVLYNIKKVAYAIRTEILSSSKQPLPAKNITVEDLRRGEAVITDGLKKFFECLLNGPDTRNVSESKERRCLSLCQDAIFCATNGKTKPAKHLQLGIVMKSCTSSKKVLNILNRLGHSVSYNVVEEMETEMAFAARQNEMLTPAGIQLSPELFTGLAWDNFDRYVETNTGKNTLHDTVGICYQNKTDNYETELISKQPGSENIESPPSDVYGRRRRTVPVINTELEPYRKKLKMTHHIDEVIESAKPESYDHAILLDNIWISLLHILKQNIPMWHGWNSTIIRDRLPETLITYLPQINQSPTSNEVVLATMKNSLRIADECSQQYIIVTYDLAIAKIALTIQFLERPRFERLFIMLGPFHIVMAFFKVMGKYIDESGANNILSETNLIAQGSLNMFIRGLHYNRCKHIHSVFSAALELLLFQQFCKTHEDISKDLESFYNESMAAQPFDPNNISDFVKDVMDKYQRFLEEVDQGLLGKTAKYWFGYLKMAKIYRRFSRSINTANIELFKASIEEMASLFFTFNHQNYSRWLVRFYNNLCNMENTHPGLTEYFQNGSLSLRRTKNNYSRSAVDLTLEQTINADAARRLTGIASFTNSVPARQRWSETNFMRNLITSKFLEDIGLTHKDEVQKDLKKSQRERSHKEIDEVIKKVINTMNPFDNEMVDNNFLFNISSGKAASHDTEQFLLNVFEKGQETKEVFIKECTEDLNRFEKPIKRIKQNTFSQEREIKKKCQKTGEILKLKMERDLFAKVVYLSMNNNIDLQTLFEYPLTPVPLSLCHYDGTKNSTQKSVLLKLLEEKCEDHQVPDRIEHYIIDGMFYLHTLQNIPNIFGRLAKQILRQVCAIESDTIHLIFDNVKSPSIKDFERDTRASNCDRAAEYSITGPEMNVPNKFVLALRNDNFKLALVEFLVNEWKKTYGDILKNKTLYVSNKEHCYMFRKSDQGNDIAVTRQLDPNLESNHLEADTRMAYQMYQKANIQGNVVVRSNDTDVLVILLGNLHHFNKQLNVWMEVGLRSNNSLRYINVRKIHNIIGHTLSKSLPGFHAYTGCDYTASFAHLGKKKPFKILEQDVHAQQAFGCLGFSEEIDNDDMKVIERYTCKMYNDPKSNKINETRLNKFVRTYKPQKGHVISQKKGIDGSYLPPCFAVLLNKMKRTNFICGIWNNVIQKSPFLENPEDNGWVLDGNQYMINWFDGPQSPRSLLNILKNSSAVDDDSDNDSSNDICESTTDDDNILSESE